jgi:hypothetical protein
MIEYYAPGVAVKYFLLGDKRPVECVTVLILVNLTKGNEVTGKLSTSTSVP